MKKIRSRRGIAFLLAVLLVIELLPYNSLAGILKAQAADKGDSYELIPDTAAVIAQGTSANMGGNTAEGNYFSINASGKDIIIDKNSKKVDDKSFNYRIKMQATGNSDGQNISFTTKKTYAQITVYAMSGSTSDSGRVLVLSNGAKDEIDKNNVDASSLNAFTYYVSGADTYHLYSASSGINIYGIKVEESDTKPIVSAPVVTASANGNKVILKWNKVPGAKLYEIFSGKDNFTDSIAKVDVSDLSQSGYTQSIEVAKKGTYTFAVKAVSDTLENSQLGYTEELNVSLEDTTGKIEESDWGIAKLGTQSDKMADPSYDKTTNKLTLSTGVAGKMANTGQSGFSVYYTKVESAAYNFTMKGRFHVTSLAKQDNQSSFGLVLLDSLGSNNAQTDYLNQLDIYAATKSEGAASCIPGIRTLIGNSDKSGKTNVGGICDVTQYFDENATVFTSDNATDLYYNFELIKNSNGYVCNWYNDDWSQLVGTKTVYNPNKFLQQDSKYVYAGFYASRIGDVEVTDMSFEQHEPTAEEIAAVDQGKWLDYDNVNVKTFNGDATADSDYTYRFTSNVTGTVTITDSIGHSYYENKEIAKSDSIEFKLSDFGYQLPLGSTTFTTVVTPYQNEVNDQYEVKYGDRLLLKDYSPVTVTDTVTRKAIGQENGTIYVSPEGKATATGTKETPFDIYTAVQYAAKGQTILLMDGVYQLNAVLSVPYSSSGTEDSPIVMKAQHTGKAILDGSKIPAGSDSALFVKGNYWHIYGLDIRNSSDGTKGVHVSGNNNVIELCNIYRNGTTGLQISYSGGEPRKWWPSGNTIKNSSSYYNKDSKLNDADGFAAKLSVGAGNVFDGCISHNNVDDGFDLYAKDKVGYGPIEPVTIKNSIAYSNGTLEDGSYSPASGNGFKLGGEGLTGKHVLTNSISYNNGGSGIMSNNGPDCQVYNSIAVDNGLFSRTGGTSSRTNVQLTPKNGTSYGGKTAYVIENVISYYTNKIKDFGTTSADKFTLKSQKDAEIYTTTNYLVNKISDPVSKNSEGNAVTDSWFESVDYDKIQPTRNQDGSIDMHGLFVLTDAAPKGVGAVLETGEKTQCNIVFKDADGSELENLVIGYGEIPEYTGNKPEKASDSMYSYEFTGWDKEFSPAIADSVYIAVYKAIPLKGEDDIDDNGAQEETPNNGGEQKNEPETPAEEVNGGDSNPERQNNQTPADQTKDVSAQVLAEQKFSNDTAKSVQTGDKNTIGFYAVLLVISMSGAGMLIYSRKKKIHR